MTIAGPARPATATPVPRRPGPTGPLPHLTLAALVVAAAGVVLVALAASVLLGAARPQVLEAGPPWWAAPALAAVRDVLACLTLGLLLLTSGVLAPSAGVVAPSAVARRTPAADGTHRVDLGPVGQGPVDQGPVRLAAACAAGASLAATTGLVVAAAGVAAGDRPSGAQEVLALLGRLWQLGGLRVLGYAAVLLLVTAVVGARARGRATLLRLAVAAAAATALVGVSGHAAGHEAMVGVSAVHVLAASAWAGGLGALLLLRATRADVAALLPRFSLLAGLCFAAVAVSGLAAVALRWQSGPPNPTWLVLAAVKLLVLVALAVVGHRQRRDVVDRARAGEPVPWHRLTRLGLVELVLMGVAAGGGVALAAA